MLVRDSMHRAGALALTRLLSMSAGHAAQMPCECGQSARNHDTRPKQLLTALGPVSVQRAYYVCPHCDRGQSPLDRELDVVGTECSPGVRRMMAVVGSDSSFDHGREQMELLAGLTVTTKAVERHAEAIGSDVERQRQVKIQGTVQSDLPGVLDADVKVLYIEVDGVQVPVRHSELEGRVGRMEGHPPRTREAKLGCVFTQTTTDEPRRSSWIRCPQASVGLPPARFAAYGLRGITLIRSLPSGSNLHGSCSSAFLSVPFVDPVPDNPRRQYRHQRCTRPGGNVRCGAPRAVQKFHSAEFLHYNAVPVDRRTDRLQATPALSAALITQNSELPVLVPPQPVGTKQSRERIVHRGYRTSVFHRCPDETIDVLYGLSCAKRRPHASQDTRLAR
jgi:hypothetical protein